MGRSQDLSRIAGAIRGASASTEARFVTVGGRLESSVDTVTGLTRTFDLLSSELKRDSLQQATRDLSQVAQRIGSLALARTSESSTFGTLIQLTSAIQSRIGRMGKSVKGVATLATNAKIAAAHIGDASVDFISFASEINRTLQLAQASLDQFAAELSGVGAHLARAIASQSALDDRQAAAMRTIPARLGRSVDAIVARSNRAAQTAQAVGQGSQRIGSRISDAVMALQIGDITRQRIEHIDYALSELNQILSGPDGEPLDESEIQALTGFCCRLQSAQLGDTAGELEREVQRILRSLSELAKDAGEILRLGQDAFGASGTRAGSFIGELEEEVAEVDRLLTGFRSARQEADNVAASVSEATTRLVSHIGKVRSLEADIRIMGLNTTFKCSRLGAVGRPLSIIAQELRVYANEIALEANEVMTELDRVVAIADQLSGRRQEGQQADIAAIAATMAASLTALDMAGKSLAQALATLEADGHAVAGLLRDTVSGTTLHDEIGRVLRQAAAELDAVARDSGGDDHAAMALPQGEQLIELMATSHTMERERNILDRFAPGRARRRAPAPAAASAELEDILF